MPPTIAPRSNSVVHPVTADTHSGPAAVTPQPPAKPAVRSAGAGAQINDLSHIGKPSRTQSLPAQLDAKTLVPAIERAKHGVDDLSSFVPKLSRTGQRLANFAHALGVNRKGMTLTSFAAKRPAKDGLNGISTAAHDRFGYDAAPATDLVNAVASGSNAIAAHSIHRRYENKIKQMLAADVERFERPDKRPRNAPIANRVDNLLLTKDNGGKWQYDRAKLARIARDDSHPLTQHARDVLTAIGIAENKGKQRSGALYQSVTSTLGVAASGLLIAGSHGALAPLVASGHLTNALKELLDLKKPFVEARQKMRDTKAATIQRYVDTVLSPHDYTDQTDDVRLREALTRRREKMNELGTPEALPDGEGSIAQPPPPEALAGVYAAVYDDARRYADSRTSFGQRLLSGMHAENKAKVHKDAERDIVVKHILSMVVKSIGRLDSTALAILAGADMAIDGTHAQRAKHALSVINEDGRVSTNRDLVAAHTLLRDAGIPKNEAALLLSQLARAEREASEAAPAAQPQAQRMKKIADLIGQPGLASNASKKADDTIKKNLGLRS